jgi:transcription initiation factor IIE alpha subunit
VTSKIASAILNNIKDTTSFTARDVAGFFPAVPFSILKDAIKELVEEKKIFTYGVKRGTFYSTNPNLNTDEKEDELNPLLISEVEAFVLGRQEFSSSDLFSTFPGHQEHILRKILIFLRDEKKMIYLHGHGKSSIWSQYSELPDTSEEKEEINQELTAKILDFAKRNMRWFKRSELDNLFEASAYDVRQALYSLMDDGEIQMRGEKRSTEYAYCEVIDTVNETEEEGERKADPVLKQNILAHIEASRIVTIPQLIEKFDTARPNIVLALRELEEEGEIYHEGIKKTSKYIHKNVSPSAAESIAKEIREEKKDEERAIEKPIDELSSLLRCNSAVYIIFIDGTQKYELRCVNALQGVTKTLFSSANAAEVCEQMFELTKGVAVELTV